MNRMSILKKIGLSVFANAVSVGVSVILTFIIPKFWGVTDYGYWQLYLFYISYVGVFHFGIQDGVYLRYGGRKENEDDILDVHSQFMFMVVVELLISCIVFMCTFFCVKDVDKRFVWYAFALCLIIYIPNTFIQYYLQAIGKVKQYAFVIIIEKVTLILVISIEMILNKYNFKELIIADLIAKFVSLVCIVVDNREIVFNKWNGFCKCKQEVLCSFKAGIFLLVSNLADSLIIGITRLAIERSWSMDIFAKTSFAISFSSFILIFIMAIGQVAFPEMKRADIKMLPQIYETCDMFFVVGGLFLFCLYTPVQMFIMHWLPAYSESCYYFIYVIPLCVFQSKSIMLLFTFYKLLRKEKLLFVLNMIGLGVTGVMVLISVNILRSVNMVLMSAMVGTVFRCLILEWYLSKSISIKVIKSMIVEVILTLLFVCIYGFGIRGDFFIYCVLYCLIICLYIKNRKGRCIK